MGHDHWQLVIATLALAISTGSVVSTLVIQRSDRAFQRQQQIREWSEQKALQANAIGADRRNALIALLNSSIPNIDPRSTKGQAAYMISLQSADELDRTTAGRSASERISYLGLLPHYDEGSLRTWLDSRPDLLRLALRVGPKDVQPSDPKGLFYVTVGLYREATDAAVDGERYRILNLLGKAESTREYRVRIMWDNRLKARVLSIGNQRSASRANDVKADLVAAQVVSAARLTPASQLDDYSGQRR